MRAKVSDHVVADDGWEVLGHISTIPPFNFEIINDPDVALERLNHFSVSNEYLGIDTEATSLEWEMPSTEMHGFSVSGAQESLYIYGRACINQQVLNMLSWILNNQKTIWYNIHYDLHILNKYGVKYTEWKQGLAQDVYVMSRLNNRSDSFSDGGLKGTAFTYLDHENLPTISNLLSQYDNDINNIPMEILGRYGAFDSRITYDLYQPLLTILSNERVLGQGDRTLHDYYKEVHLRASEGTFRMEENGMHINVDFLKEIDKKATEVINSTGDFWTKATGCNMNSSAQKTYFFFNVMGHKPKKKTSAGKASVTSNILKDLAIDGDIWAGVYAKVIGPATKIKSTYTEPILDRVHRLGEPVVHGSFSIPRARTGRTASSDPNLQNIPARGMWGKLMRQAFDAPPNYMFCRADFSQLELRVLAHFTQDKAWLDLFFANGDAHELTSETVGVTRDQAKVVNFGIIYGMSPKALAINMKDWGAGNISEQQAEEIISIFYSNFSQTREWMDKVILYARKLGYVQTILGRKRWLPDINVRNTYDRGKAERQAVNTIIQGSAADIMNIGTINTIDVIDNYNAYAKANDLLLMMLADVVHDEIGCYIPVNKYMQALAKRVGTALEQAGEYCKLIVPLVAQPELGNNWAEVKE